MKIKLDENLPLELVSTLERLGHDVDTVEMEDLAGSVDQLVFAAAQSVDRLLITQDLDFSDIRQFQPGTHARIVLIRLRDPSWRRLIERVKRLTQTIALNDLSACFTVITDLKVRVRRP